MDFYLTEKLTGNRLPLSMLPEHLEHKSGASFERYNIIKIGPVEVHNGNELSKFSWGGKLPKRSMKGMSFVKEWYWYPPEQVERLIRGWQESGAILNFMVTETNINYDVTIREFNINLKGENFWDYSIELAEHKDLRIYTVQEAANRKMAGKARIMSNAAFAREKQISYTIKKGDTLWNLAKRYLGNGALYTKIYELNRDVIGPDPLNLQAGIVVTLPV